MAKRITISVDNDIPDLLLNLAGSQRKQGEFISSMVRAAHENRQVSTGVTTEGLRMQVVGLTAEMSDLRGRLLEVESRIGMQ